MSTPESAHTESRPADRYAAAEIEPKWQARWRAANPFAVPIEALPARDEKYYLLEMFPYPSGEGLHIGHARVYTIGDALAKFHHLNGKTVMRPMGFDAFGLPAENAALKHGTHPAEWTERNMARFKDQMELMGWAYDWSREAATCTPAYYHWTQWLFLQMLDKGLAYRKKAWVNWCPSCNTTLANEQVVDGACERCETVVVKRDIVQWFYKITDYAEELLHGLDHLKGWPESVKSLQRNWIGRSEGCEAQFKLEGRDDSVAIFTTRPDTLYGVTYMVLAPEHPLVRELIPAAPESAALQAFVDTTVKQKEYERTAEDTEKAGMFTGAYAINPVNGERIPVWVGNYVLMEYGTGAVMAVPAHDQRDHEFATKYGLPIRTVIVPFAPLTPNPSPQQAGGDGDRRGGSQRDGDQSKGNQKEKETDAGDAVHSRGSAPAPLSPALGGRGAGGEGSSKAGGEGAFCDPGTMIDSGDSAGVSSTDFKQQIMDRAEREGWGKRVINYRLRDWLLSRQRYWGAPIPVVYCDTHGMQPVPADQLPVLLPRDVDFKPTGQISPLATSPTFLHTTCPTCGGPATRETDTMDTFVDSSWYYTRYTDPQNDTAIFRPDHAAAWLPVDEYIGGIEHAILHLMYFRFLTKVMRDLGLIAIDEPATNLLSQGMVIWGGQKMSKSKGNTVDPLDLVRDYSADAVRAFILFAAPPEGQIDWADHIENEQLVDGVKVFHNKGVDAAQKFLNRIWRQIAPHTEWLGAHQASMTSVMPSFGDSAVAAVFHPLLQEITLDYYPRRHLNTVVSGLMKLSNALADCKHETPTQQADFATAVGLVLRVLAPVAPHLAEEMWESCGFTTSIFSTRWPEADQAVLASRTVTCVVQVNGKVRDNLQVAQEIGEAELVELAKTPKVMALLDGREIRKVIARPPSLVNFVG